MAKKAKSFEQYLVEYIATATVEQTQTALNFLPRFASQKIAANAPAAAAKPAKATKAAKPALRRAPHQFGHADRRGLTSSSTGRLA